MKLNLRGDTLVGKNGAGEDVFIPALFWSSAYSFLDAWDKPLGALAPGDNSQHGDEIKHRLQTGLRAIVRHSSVMCGLPALEASGEALVARLDAILGASGKVGLPAAFYAPVFMLREWLRGRAVELLSIEQRAGMNDQEWDTYVQRIGSGG
jgi:hypothetical protein